MSKTGDWGDKVIITLHSDGKRRHKLWCDNYCNGNCCTVFQGKCIGSAHCEYYKNPNEERSEVFYPKILPDREGEEQTIVSKSGFVWCEVYRQASYGDRLLGKTVLVRNTPHTFRICEVLEEDFYFFNVRFDGREHRYSKRVAYQNKSVYIYNGINEFALDTMEETI